MKVQYVKWLGSVVVAVLPLVAGRAETPADEPSTAAPAAPAAPAAAAPAATPANFSPKVGEVVKLAQSGVGDDVVAAYVKNCQAPFRLSANDILALKNAGVAPSIISAMLAHDNALRTQREAAAGSPAPAPAPAAAPAAPASGPYTYSQRNYGSPDAPAAPVPAPVAQPVAPAQPVTPAQPVPPQQPVAPAPVVVEQAPPPAQLEVVPLAPGPDYYWTPGYWSWRGGVWVWTGGCWLHRPYAGAVWVGGHWGRHGRGYVWIGGRWH